MGNIRIMIFFSFSPHPHTRVTFWTTLIGNCIMFLGIWSVNQACTQRFLAIPKQATSQMSVGKKWIANNNYMKNVDNIYGRYGI